MGQGAFRFEREDIRNGGVLRHTRWSQTETVIVSDPLSRKFGDLYCLEKPFGLKRAMIIGPRSKLLQRSAIQPVAEGIDVIAIPDAYLSSLYHGFWHRKLFDGVRAFVLFLGYPRSGHTLVGFLLDAHRNIIVASQVSSLRFHKYGFAKEQIFYLLAQNSRRVAEVGRGHRTYSYNIPGQWQGRFEGLKVIGDSTGLSRLRRRPALLKSLQGKLDGAEVKLITCLRNPYDNISTMMLRTKCTLQQSIDQYFSISQRIEEIQRQVEDATIYNLRHEALIASPGSTLKGLCAFLGVTAGESYYEDCASIIYESPHKSRFEVPWNQELIDAVKRKADRFNFLKGYSYGD